jgi:hypothetical protein
VTTWLIDIFALVRLAASPDTIASITGQPVEWLNFP